MMATFEKVKELRVREFPVPGINMIKLFQKQIRFTTKNKRYTYRQALFDMIEYAYINVVEKGVRKPKS